MKVTTLDQTQLSTAYTSKAAVHYLLNFRSACTKVAEDTGRPVDEIIELLLEMDDDILRAENICYEQLTEALYSDVLLESTLVRHKHN